MPLFGHGPAERFRRFFLPVRDRLQAAIKAHLLSSLEHSDYTSASIRAFAFLPPELRKTCRVERRRYEDIWQQLMQDASQAGYIPKDVSLDAARLMLLGYGVGLSWGSALVDIEPGCRIAHTEWPAHG